MSIDEASMSGEEANTIVPAAAAINPPPLLHSPPPPELRKRRFQSTASISDGTLAEVAMADDGGVDDLLRRVVGRLQSDGHIVLKDAAAILQKKHTGRALDKILAKLPVIAFARSRKDGWIIIPKDEDEQYDAVMLLINRIGELQDELDSFGNFTAE